MDRFEWLSAPPQEPWQGVAFANEVVDALPVDRFRVRAEGCEAIGVSASAEGFALATRPPGAALADAVKRLQLRLPSPMPEGFVSELRPGQREWLAASSSSLERGAFLIVDYGLPRAQYYHPSRDGGTLCAFRQHRRVEDVLAHPGSGPDGLVDFSALADDGNACGLELGVSPPKRITCCRRASSASSRPRRAAGNAREGPCVSAATLLLPGEMGSASR
jgi:SAM-dependent MidA family methyltransferase